MRKFIAVTVVMVGVAFAFAASARVASAQVPPSGLALGANLTPFVGPAPGQGPAVAGGLRVNFTVPGHSAHGLLLPGDVLHGGLKGSLYAPLLTMADLEDFKARVGPGRSAKLQVYRPNVGYYYVWVTFTRVR